MGWWGFAKREQLPCISLAFRQHGLRVRARVDHWRPIVGSAEGVGNATEGADAICRGSEVLGRVEPASGVVEERLGPLKDIGKRVDEGRPIVGSAGDVGNAMEVSGTAGLAGGGSEPGAAGSARSGAAPTPGSASRAMPPPPPSSRRPAEVRHDEPPRSRPRQERALSVRMWAMHVPSSAHPKIETPVVSSGSDLERYSVWRIPRGARVSWFSQQVTMPIDREHGFEGSRNGSRGRCVSVDGDWQ